MSLFLSLPLPPSSSLTSGFRCKGRGARCRRGSMALQTEEMQGQGWMGTCLLHSTTADRSLFPLPEALGERSFVSGRDMAVWGVVEEVILDGGGATGVLFPDANNRDSTASLVVRKPRGDGIIMTACFLRFHFFIIVPRS